MNEPYTHREVQAAARGVVWGFIWGLLSGMALIAGIVKMMSLLA